MDEVGGLRLLGHEEEEEEEQEEEEEEDDGALDHVLFSL